MKKEHHPSFEESTEFHKKFITQLQKISVLDECRIVTFGPRYLHVAGSHSAISQLNFEKLPESFDDVKDIIVQNGDDPEELCFCVEFIHNLPENIELPGTFEGFSVMYFENHEPDHSYERC